MAVPFRIRDLGDYSKIPQNWEPERSRRELPIAVLFSKIRALFVGQLVPRKLLTFWVPLEIPGPVWGGGCAAEAAHERSRGRKSAGFGWKGAGILTAHLQ